MSSLHRTYSSPSLRRPSSRADSTSFPDENQVFFIIGDRVYLDRFRPASVAYFGEVEFSSGDWVGLVLDNPTGNHDGRVHGRRYFQCEPLHGIFARPNRVSRIVDEEEGNWSRVSTPLPTNELFATRRSSRKSPLMERAEEILERGNSRSSSGLGASYIYDEDYRNSPSYSNLEQRLKSFERSASLPRQSGGILKRPTSTSRPSSRADEILEKLERATAPSLTTNNRSVFEFRPKRTQLEEYENYQDRVRRHKSTNDLSTEPLKVNDRVTIRTQFGDEGATLRYLGETEFATGQWAGLELDAPTGRNDGSVLGHRYFYCPQNYGLFVPAIRVKRNFGNIRNTLKSPPYVSNHRQDLYSSSYEDRPYSASSSAYSPSPNQHTFSSSTSDIYDNYSPHYGLTNRSNTTRGDSRTPHNSYLSSSPSSKYISVAKTMRPTKSNKSPAKSVVYTFTSSKYDGNPVANRTLMYN